jgi:sulfite reductase (ferredoxin)
MSNQIKHADDWSFQTGTTLKTELNEFAGVVGQFKNGAINEAQFRSVRVPLGVYEQRESGTYMLRVRFPAGGVLPRHLRRLGEVSAQFGNGLLHVTTRQEFQIHRVPLDSVLAVQRSLADVGLSTKGGGGNTVRNITACVDSGVCAEQVFDVTPYAVATTERLLADPVSLQLPRKYKIAFAACARDCAGATVQDLGFIARKRDGVEGFAAYVAGGMGGKSRLGSQLHEFVPATDVFLVAEAVKRVFDQHGDRKNKHLARLRFLVERIGLPKFLELYEAELTALRAGRIAPLQIRPLPQPADQPVTGVPPGQSPAFDRWLAHNVAPQLQPGYFLVQIPLALGDLPAAVASPLADVLTAHGDHVLWATQAQNVALRWLTAAELPRVHEQLAALGLAEPDAPALRNLVVCAGASTCRLGICLSRGLAKAVRKELVGSTVDLDRLGNFSIHLSGCPNSCGRHPIASLGFSGAARRVGGNLAPYYAVQLGGRVGEGRTRFGVNIGAVPAKHAPAFARELLAAWQDSPAAQDFHQFLDGEGRRVAQEILNRHQVVPPLASGKDFYCDWDAATLFSLTGRGQGECGAGVFDLIEVDLANAREAQEAGRYYEAALAACRALLVTQRVQPKTDAEAFALFQRHFLAAGLVDTGLTPVVEAGARAAGTAHAAGEFVGTPAEVAALVAAIRLLHENMDSSLRFKPQGK